MTQAAPPGNQPRRRINPRMAIAIVALVGAGAYLYIRHKNSAAASSASAPSAGEAAPDNTYEQSSSATAEFGQQEGEISNIGQSVAAAQAAESATQGNVTGLQYGGAVEENQINDANKQLANQTAQLKSEQAQITKLSQEVAALRKPPPKKPPAKKPAPKKVHA